MRKNYPSLVHVGTLTDPNQDRVAAGISTPKGIKWVPARGMGYPSFRSRVRLAWLVFTGKADALVWEQQ
ncbi:hypothetical protein D9M68_18100 [compost metagenome]